MPFFRITLLSAVIFALAIIPAYDSAGQAPVRMELLPESRIWVDGTSNRDDWTVDATKIDADISFVTGTDLRVESARVIVPAREIKGGRSTVMDRITHNALKANQHSEIVFELTEAHATGAQDAAATFRSAGKLTIAGTTRDVQIPVSIRLLDGGVYRITGEHRAKMSDFDMTPPTAMFGALRTGDEVVIHFDLRVGPAGG